MSTVTRAVTTPEAEEFRGKSDQGVVCLWWRLPSGELRYLGAIYGPCAVPEHDCITCREGEMLWDAVWLLRWHGPRVLYCSL